MTANASLSAERSVAIVGAGPGGLAAALLLAASGLHVTVYEAHDRVGGRSRRLSQDGFHWDCGPTFFMMPYVLEEIVRATGHSLHDHAELVRLNPMYRLLHGQPGAPAVQIDATQDVARMVQQFEARRAGDGVAFRRFLDDNRAKLAAMTPMLEAPMRGLYDLLTLDALKVSPKIKPWQSLHAHLGEYFQDPLVRLSLCFQSKYLGMSPFECPSLFSILPFIEYEFGIWHPTGGCNALMQAMGDIARSMGVRLHMSSPVERLTFDGCTVRGVVVDGLEHRHGQVIVNADATWAMKNLIPAELRRRDQQDGVLDAKRYSCSTVMMYLGLDGAIDLPHHTIYTSETYSENLKDIAERGCWSDDPSIYACNPSRIDPTLAPEGSSSLYVLLPSTNNKAGHCTLDWDAMRPKLRADALHQLEHRLGIPDMARRIRTERLVTPADWQSERINHGATFNLAHNLGQMLHLRPQHRLPGFDGLWLVGGGTHPGSGLPVIFLSSQITSRMLCEELGTPFAMDRVATRPAARELALA